MVEEGEFKKRVYEEGGNLLEDVPSIIEIDREKFDAIVEQAKKEFPIEFWWAVIGVDEEGETVEEQRIMPNAKLPENRANAR